jgi:hypothetical protein
MNRHYGKYALIAVIALALGSANLARAEGYEVSPQAVYYTALKGNYSYFGTSYYGYYLTQGTLTFDGKGHVSGTMNYNVDTVPCVGMTLNGTYTVNPGLASGSTLMSLTSVNTNGCGNTGNGDTLFAEIAIGGGGNTLFLAEMDQLSADYFAYDFFPFGATATHY